MVKGHAVKLSELKMRGGGSTLVPVKDVLVASGVPRSLGLSLTIPSWIELSRGGGGLVPSVERPVSMPASLDLFRVDLLGYH
jgi:hypothetical protein